MEIRAINRFSKLWVFWIPAFISDFFVAGIITVFMKKGFLFFLLILFTIALLPFAISFVLGFFAGTFIRLRRLKRWSQHLFDFLKHNNFPAVGDYQSHPIYYFEEIMGNSNLPTEIRIKAAMEYAQIAMLKEIGQKRLLLLISMAWKAALEEYHRSIVKSISP